jgi:hypothetical protein
MTSKKVLFLIEKSGQVAAGKELGGNETSTARARGNAFLKPVITLTTRGIGRTFDVFPEGL